jgi:hypothetical protein
MQKMLTTRQVKGELRKRVNLDYSLQHISYLINQGRFPGAVKGPAKNSRWQIPESAVDHFVSTLKIAGKAQTES